MPRFGNPVRGRLYDVRALVRANYVSMDIGMVLTQHAIEMHRTANRSSPLWAVIRKNGTRRDTVIISRRTSCVSFNFKRRDGIGVKKEGPRGTTFHLPAPEKTYACTQSRFSLDVTRIKSLWHRGRCLHNK